MDINNRRYIGSKASLVEEIYNSISFYKKKNIVFADLFAGTGIVGNYMLNKNMDIILNDTLYSNFVIYDAWFGKEKINIKKIEKIIKDFSILESKKLKDNYFSKIYGNKYFSNNDAKKIGYIRDEIDKLKLNKREKNILITSLIYRADKIANTVGHFEHFLSKELKDKDVVLTIPNIEIDIKNNVDIYNQNANDLVKNIKCDIAYIDPPYNARQYINFYHVLENLARWEKPTKFEGTSMKFERNHLKSDYSKAKAPKVFEDLINNLKCKVIVVSYNNTYTANSISSNNKISEKEIISILSKRGKVTKKEIKHKFFNSGKTDFKNHIEKIFICVII